MHLSDAMGSRETTLISRVRLVGEAGSLCKVEPAPAGREGPGHPLDSGQAPASPRPQFPLPGKGEANAHLIYFKGLVMR